MANDGVEAFLQAEEDAHRLVEALARLKEEVDSYKTAREALDQAADGVSRLTARLGAISGELATVVETLRSIGTPELLQEQKELADEVVSLRQELAGSYKSIAEGLARADVAQTTVRNFVLGSLGLSLIALALLGWLLWSLPGG
jgi:hypothetical protein